MKYLIASIIGAIIGYLTNWLAIKMLFRPHNEVRIFGIKMPFTPGLIPKEKNRIAASVGETIGKHLLSKETIVESLCSREMNLKLKQGIENKVKALINSTYTLEFETKKIIGEKYETFMSFINRKIFNTIINHINNEKIINNISREIFKLLNELMKKDMSFILDNSFYKDIKGKILDKGKYAITSKQLSEYIIKEFKKKLEYVNEKEIVLKEIIPKSFISTIQVCIYNNDEKICDGIKQLLNEEKAKEKVMNFIKGMISSNLSPMIGMFLDPAMLTSKFISGVDKYLQVEENRKEIVIIINEALDRVLESKASDVMNNFSESMIDSNIESIVALVNEKILNEKLVDSIYEIMENKLRDKKQIINIIKISDIEDKFIELSNKGIETIINNSRIQDKIQYVVSESISNLMNNKLCDITEGREEKIVSISCEIAQDIFNRFIENQASDVVETLNVAKIVENKINEFDVSFAEEVILEIASKELSAITWLGGLLGGIIGILSPLLSSIY